MDAKLTAVKHYLAEVFGAEDNPVSWGSPKQPLKGIPHYLTELYRFCMGGVAGTPCLFMMSKSREGETPAVVKKHWNTVSGFFEDDVIYVVESISSFNRKRLIERKVPFVVPGNQLYLPMCGIDLREHFKSLSNRTSGELSAIAQLLVLGQIQDLNPWRGSARSMAETLGYSAMTLTRAVNELIDHGLAEAEQVGREKRLKFALHPKPLWEAAQNFLSSPVKKRINVSRPAREFPGLVAGESALARQSMIVEPRVPVFAVYAADWPAIKKGLKLEDRNARDPDSIQVELWKYPPSRLADGDCVDRLSLYLSLKDVEDERLAMALESVVGSVWS